MVTTALEAIASFLVWVISTAGYLGVSLLMAVESACIPLPSEVIMPFAGYLVSLGVFNLPLVATAGAIGCNVGSTAAYYVAARGGDAVLRRWGRTLLITPEEIEWVKGFFLKYGAATVFVGRLLPVVRTFIAVPAGLARMPQWKFQAYTFAGSWLWCLGLTYMGQKLGEKWNTDARLRSWFHSFDLVILVLLVGGAAWIVWRRICSQRPTGSR